MTDAPDNPAVQHYSTDAPICPYCHEKQSHDGGYWYDEMRCEAECGHCDKTFAVSVYTSTSWTTEAKP